MATRRGCTQYGVSLPLIDNQPYFTTVDKTSDIDLAVAAVTLSVGMVQLPPVMVSAPLKILLFVLADGWNLVIGSLVRSFTT